MRQKKAPQRLDPRSKTVHKPKRKAAKSQKQGKKQPPLEEGMELLTREGWLRRAVELLLPFVRQAAAWASVPAALTVPPRVSCSWPSGRATKALSQSAMVGEGEWSILMSPMLGHESLQEADEKHDLQVLAHLAHELVHCVSGQDRLHGGAFRRIAEQIGLAIPIARPRLAPGLGQQMREQILARIGHYPHVSESLPSRPSGGNRQKKWICENCGKIVRCAGDLQALHLCEDGARGRFMLAEKS